MKNLLDSNWSREACSKILKLYKPDNMFFRYPPDEFRPASFHCHDCKIPAKHLDYQDRESLIDGALEHLRDPEHVANVLARMRNDRKKVYNDLFIGNSLRDHMWNRERPSRECVGAV